MKTLNQKYMLSFAGALLGGVAGFFYWKFIGCASGSCFIQSNPFRMTLFGALMGGFLLNRIITN